MTGKGAVTRYSQRRQNQAVRTVAAGALAILLSCFLLPACGAPEPLIFDGEAAYAHVVAQCDSLGQILI